MKVDPTLPIDPCIARLRRRCNSFGRANPINLRWHNVVHFISITSSRRFFAVIFAPQSATYSRPQANGFGRVHTDECTN
jgi:hypothetical protein